MDDGAQVGHVAVVLLGVVLDESHEYLEEVLADLVVVEFAARLGGYFVPEVGVAGGVELFVVDGHLDLVVQAPVVLAALLAVLALVEGGVHLDTDNKINDW